MGNNFPQLHGRHNNREKWRAEESGSYARIKKLKNFLTILFSMPKVDCQVYMDKTWFLHTRSRKEQNLHYKKHGKWAYFAAKRGHCKDTNETRPWHIYIYRTIQCCTTSNHSDSTSTATVKECKKSNIGSTKDIDCLHPFHLDLKVHPNDSPRSQNLQTMHWWLVRWPY